MCEFDGSLDGRLIASCRCVLNKAASELFSVEMTVSVEGTDRDVSAETMSFFDDRSFHEVASNRSRRAMKSS